jgi:hypothetical protein
MYEREVTGKDSIRAKMLSFSASLDFGRYNRQPTDTSGYGPSRDYSELLQKMVGRNRLKCTTCTRWPGERKRATFWSQCYPQVLSRRRQFFSWELLRAKLQDYQVSLANGLTKSHDVHVFYDQAICFLIQICR